MNKEERIRRYGKKNYEMELEKHRLWSRKNFKTVKYHHDEANRKGGLHYKQKLKQNSEGLQGDRGRLRRIDGHSFRKYKRFFAQESQLHHQWIRGTANHTGIALVERDQHMHGYIDVLLIFNGEITVFDEHAGVEG